jgi:flavin-dependent dehydrogenase
MHALVVGASVAGLATGLALSRAGHEVTILDRDRDPLPGSPAEAAKDWRRGVVPQARQSHGFICRVRADLQSRAPDLWRDLLAAGAVPMPLFDKRPAAMRDCPTEPGDDDLEFLACSRTTFEWVLRRAAERECAIRLGVRAQGLLLDESGRSVAGVATSQGPMLADFVVDASGRAGGLTRRLHGTGFTLRATSDEPCGIVYATRFYRLRDGTGWGPLNRMWAAGGMFAGYSCMLFPHDNNTFSVNFGRLPADRALAEAHTTSGFTRAVEHVPFVSSWVHAERAEPLGPPVPMAGIHNKLSGPAPLPGLFAVGDAACTTDPSFGRGIAIAIASAFALSDALSSSNLGGTAERYEAWFAENVTPWHDDSVRQDRTRTAMWEAAISGTAPSAPSGDGRAIPPGLVAAAGITGADPLVWRAFVRYAGMLAPTTRLQDPDVVAAVGVLLRDGWTPPAAASLSHREMVQVIKG